MKLPFAAYLALRYTRANLKQSAIVAFSVGLGVSIIIFTPSVNLTFFNDLLKKVVEDAPHIRVTREMDTFARNQRAINRLLTQVPPPSAGPNTGTPAAWQAILSDRTLTRRRNITGYRALMRQLEAWPGVTYTAPFITEQAIVAHGAQVRGGALRGIVPRLEARVSSLEEDVISGQLDALGDQDIFLGWRLAEELHVSPGQRVKVFTAFGQRSYRVAGLTKTGVAATDLAAMVVSLHSMQRLVNLPNQVTGISLRILDIYAARDMAQALGKRYGLKARSWMEDNQTFLEQISAFRIIVSMINFLIVFASASSITSVLIMIVASKSREIGILKAMGARPRVLMQVFVLQALCLSLLGVGVGVLGGQGWISLYNASPFSKAETVLGVERKPVQMSSEFTLYAIFFALLSSVLASFIPAWQAGRLDPVKAIQAGG
jgi:ABC-type lipoprotein release transport system permease subunit